MAGQGLGDLLEECLRAATTAGQPTQQMEEARRNYRRCRDSLCAQLASLLREAEEMRWPFVPEKWQYKRSIGADDKTNLSDLISRHLLQLLVVLKVSIVAQEAGAALAIVFLVDRFLYWTDESSRLLNIAKLLHKRQCDAPIAPQLVIRQARVYLNSGKLQKAEYILSSLINNSGTTGCWVYHCDSDRALVQAVSVQVRGMVLQKLGLWREAAELIWASLVGYYALPEPDKKGIGTSLGILANVLVSMSDEDFRAFKSGPDIDLSLLGDGRHRLLAAAEAARMAVVYSQYASLYVLTNVAIQGTCLLSYSFSAECPPTQRRSFLLRARDAFVIGLLTKAEGELVASKQELHTFLKAAYSLAIAHKWLGTASEVVAQATEACKIALGHFYDYCHADAQDKDGFCTEIMQLIARVKRLLQVKPFINSDKGSFIPDSYGNIKDTLVNFTLEGFWKVMHRFRKYHASLCETTNTKCKGGKDEIDGAGVCLTALATTVVALNTECSTEGCRVPKDVPKGEGPTPRGSLQSPHRTDQCSTPNSTDELGSSWQNFSLSGSGSHQPSSTGSSAMAANASNPSCPTTEDDYDNDNRSERMQDPTDENRKQNSKCCNDSVSSSSAPRAAIPVCNTSSSNASRDSENFEILEHAIDTLATADDWVADVIGGSPGPSVVEGAAHSLSQFTLKTSSSCLSNSFGSQSSWEKLSVDQKSTSHGGSQTTSLAKAGTCQSSRSQESNESFCILETLDSETHDSADNPMHANPTLNDKPRPLKTLNGDRNSDTEIGCASGRPAINSSLAAPNMVQFVPEQCATTEPSDEISFEMLEVSQCGSNEAKCEEAVVFPQRRNPLCHSCHEHSSTAGNVPPERQYLLSQQDYYSLLGGVCHECLLRRLHSDKTQFKLKTYSTAHGALHLKFSKATGLWTARETCVYIGEPMGMKGNQRAAIWVQFLHQEERLSSYVAKDYLKPKEIQFHLKDVERQMTAQYYVTEFNKSLYDREVMAQIFFIPSEALLILSGDEIVGCVTVEPYMLGDFVKLTNNKEKTDMSLQATKYGLAFGHFTYLFSECQEVVVDLQGWVTGNGKGLTYLTDPQIHSTKTTKGPSNFADRGIRYFLEEQHGPDCNSICQLLKLPPVARRPQAAPPRC